MNQIANTIIAATAIFGIAARGTMDPSSLAMAISFVMQVCFLPSTTNWQVGHYVVHYVGHYVGLTVVQRPWTLSQVGMNLTISNRFLCELEVQIVSAERIKEYCELPSEVTYAYGLEVYGQIIWTIPTTASYCSIICRRSLVSLQTRHVLKAAAMDWCL